MSFFTQLSTRTRDGKLSVRYLSIVAQCGRTAFTRFGHSKCHVAMAGLVISRDLTLDQPSIVELPHPRSRDSMPERKRLHKPVIQGSNRKLQSFSQAQTFGPCFSLNFCLAPGAFIPHNLSDLARAYYSVQVRGLRLALTS